MLQMGQHLRSDGTVDTSSFKIVYVAPMKALVAEMVGNFSQRLKKFGMQVDSPALLSPRSLGQGGCLAIWGIWQSHSRLEHALAMACPAEPPCYVLLRDLDAVLPCTV